jgi:hypothetical protein
MTEHTQNIDSFGIDPPAIDDGHSSPHDGEYQHGELHEELVESAMDAGADARSGWSTRQDGWTPDRIRVFLTTLAECGIVADAAEAAEMSIRSAYALRNSAKGRAFHLAWRAALLVARHRVADALMSRALGGCVERVYRNGRLWQETHRYDNRLLLAVLARLENKCSRGNCDAEAAEVEPEFDALVDVVTVKSGGVGAFLRSNKKRIGEQTEEVALIERDVDGLPESADGQTGGNADRSPDDPGFGGTYP